LNEGDIVRVHTAHGGGHGDPRERSRDLVLDDLRNEYVSVETARDVYGVDASMEGAMGPD
jgi:N-methylhydantoinase B